MYAYPILIKFDQLRFFTKLNLQGVMRQKEIRSQKFWVPLIYSTSVCHNYLLMLLNNREWGNETVDTLYKCSAPR